MFIDRELVKLNDGMSRQCIRVFIKKVGRVKETQDKWVCAKCKRST